MGRGQRHCPSKQDTALIQPNRREVWVGTPTVGEVGEGSHRTVLASFLLRICGQLGVEGKPAAGAPAGKGGNQRGGWPCSRAPHPSRHHLQTTGSGRSGPGQSGPASSLPSSPAGRGNYSPGSAFYFLKPDQRWDPAGSPSKISAMWSLGVSAGETGSRGRDHPPQALAAGVRGSEARGESGAELVGGGQSGRIRDWKNSAQAAFSFVCVPQPFSKRGLSHV